MKNAIALSVLIITLLAGCASKSSVELAVAVDNPNQAQITQVAKNESVGSTVDSVELLDRKKCLDFLKITTNMDKSSMDYEFVADAILGDEKHLKAPKSIGTG